MTLAASRCAVLALGICVLPGTAEAQALWLDRDDRDVVFVEIYKPLVEGGGQPFAASGTLLGARKVLRGGRLALVVDVPVTHVRSAVLVAESVATHTGIDTAYAFYRYHYILAGEPTTEIGNPYFGIEFPGAWTHELGIRIETPARYGEQEFGEAAELERPAFATRVTTVHYGLTRRPPRTLGVHWRWRFAFLLPMGYDVTYVVSYRGMLQIDRPRFRLAGGLAGIANVDPRGRGAFDERTAHQLEAIAEVSLGAWRPALHVRRWLDQYASDAVPLVIGARLEWRPQSPALGGAR